MTDEGFPQTARDPADGSTDRPGPRQPPRTPPTYIRTDGAFDAPDDAEGDRDFKLPSPQLAPVGGRDLHDGDKQC